MKFTHNRFLPGFLIKTCAQMSGSNGQIRIQLLSAICPQNELQRFAQRNGLIPDIRVKPAGRDADIITERHICNQIARDRNIALIVA